MRANMISQIAETINKLVKNLIVVCMGLLLLIVTFNVFARYILKVGLTWAEEFSLLLFVWVVFLGSYLALSKKAHLALAFIIRRLPPRVSVVSRYIILVLVTVFVLIVCIGGFAFVINVINLNQRTPLLGISAAWAYASLPISMALMLLELIKNFICKEHIIRIDS